MNSARSLVLLLLVSGAAWGDSVEEWLMRINDAATGLSYEGVFVYTHGSNLESMQVVHHVEDGVVRERIYSLNGAPREIIRDAEQIWCYVPEENMGVHDYRHVPKQNFTKMLPERLGELTNNYALDLGREGRMTNRRAQQILILPRDEYRYGYVLWADLETGLLLKAALVSSDMEPVEQYMFTRVNIGDDVDTTLLAPSTQKDMLKWFGPPEGGAAPTRADIDNPGWVITELPDGFEMTRQLKRMSPLNNSMMEHYVYTDGLAAVSVFVEALGGGGGTSAQIDGLNQIGAFHAYGHTRDGYHVTVVGGVPSRTVDMMGSSAQKVLK